MNRWGQFQSVLATHWLRGLLGLLGAFAILMAVSAASVVTIVIGLVGGAALVAAGIMCGPGPGKRALVMACVALTLPFAAMTWWTIVTPLLTIVALAIGFAATDGSGRRSQVSTVEPLDPQPIG
jgi:hypothetical protein